MNFPFAKSDILLLSYTLQHEWRFAKEKELMQYTIQLFPDWAYAKQRLEWHARPIFHRDPTLSQTQPRPAIHLPRDLHTPKPETLSSLCFVTGAGSEGPYFNICVQLLESIKATRWYNMVPIKVLDCGLTPDDANYLRQRFDAEVKDPGWDIAPEIVIKSKLKSGMKGCTARPYLHKHFPGFEYYFWLDADTWIQDERILDRMICYAEKQGLYATKDLDNIWTEHKDFAAAIPSYFLEPMMNRRVILNSAYCINRALSEKLALASDFAISQVGVYKWGFEMAMLNYIFYKEVSNGFIDNSNAWHYIYLMMFKGAYFDEHQMMYTRDRELVGIACLAGWVKHAHPHWLFTQDGARELHIVRLCQKINGNSEELFRIQQLHNLHKGCMFYRTFLTPEQLYGPMERIAL